jgi:choline dehydrogenase
MAHAASAYDVAVAGGGTAGCVVAARLSEDPDRTVCLVEAGPDYGPLTTGGWPEDMLNASAMPRSHDWGTGAEDNRSLGARIIGGSSAHNACCILAGTPADYDAWGDGWSYDTFAPYLALAQAELQTARANTEDPVRFHAAFMESAQALGFPLLSEPNDADQLVGVAPFPANVVDGVRWNTAFAYLDPARARPNLTVLPETLVDRVVLDGSRATGVVTNRGTIEADQVVLAAGTYFTAAILVRSGIGSEAELRRLGVTAAAALPVGEVLRDHYGAALAWEPVAALEDELAAHDPLYEAHVMLKAASSACPPGSLDLHFPSWVNRSAENGHFEVRLACFLMQPRSHGRVLVRSTDPRDLPVVEHGFLTHPVDLEVLLEGLDLGRAVAAAAPLRDLLVRETRPGDDDEEEFLRQHVSTYYHPVGTCPIGSVVDTDGGVLGFDNLTVADASIMPTIPRANTNLTVVAIAERIAATLRASN